jgi:Zn-dependent M28 family amino/carboxypeptidase
MEMARVITSQRPGVSIDFIFFDVEDQGCPDWADNYVEDSWCKGSQYWSANPHTPFYTAVYGVLFDMVGTEQPRYTKEEVSRQYAPGVLNKMWAAAAALGHDKIFENTDTDPILDDHYYVNRIAKVPMIDIVQNTRGMSFFEHWHTVDDNLDHIDRNTLRITAEVVLKTIYGDYGSK